MSGAGSGALTQRGASLRGDPVFEAITKLGVLVGPLVGMALAVLVPKILEAHAVCVKFVLDVIEVGLGVQASMDILAWGGCHHGRIQDRFRRSGRGDAKSVSNGGQVFACHFLRRHCVIDFCCDQVRRVVSAFGLNRVDRLCLGLRATTTNAAAIDTKERQVRDVFIGEFKVPIWIFLSIGPIKGDVDPAKRPSNLLDGNVPLVTFNLEKLGRGFEAAAFRCRFGVGHFRSPSRWSAHLDDGLLRREIQEMR